MDSNQWEKIFNQIYAPSNSSRKNPIGIIKEELYKQNNSVFKGWANNKYKVDYKFNTIFTRSNYQINLTTTLLHIAAYHGYLDTVKYFISKRHLTTKSKDDCGNIPLHMATLNGCLDIVKYFVDEKKVAPDIKNNNGDTPLHTAAVYGNLQVFEYLIDEKKVALDVKNNDVDNLYNIAMRRGYKEIAEYLTSLKKVAPDVKNNDVDNSLCIADKNVFSETTEPRVIKKNNYEDTSAAEKNFLQEKEKNRILRKVRGSMQVSMDNNYDANEIVSTKVTQSKEGFNQSKAHLKENERDLGILKQELEKAESKNDKIQELSTQNTALEDQNKELEKLKGENENKSQQLEALKSQSKQSEGQIEVLKTQLKDKNKELGNISQKVVQLERERDSAKQDLAKETKELKNTQAQLEQENDNLASQVGKLKGELEKTKAEFAKERDQLLSENNRLTKEKVLDLDNENKKLSAAGTHGRRQVIYASVSFVLSVALAVGASLTIPDLAIYITLAVATLTFLATGCYCSYKANTTLSNIEADQVSRGTDVVVQNSL